MIVHGTKLAIAFLSATLANAVIVALLPYASNTAAASFGALGMGLALAILLYIGLRKLLLGNMTYMAFVLSILLGIAIFYLTVL